MGTNKKTICVVTGTRAEYGLLYWLMKSIESDPDLDLQLVVTGAHLSSQYGKTQKMIENDGFTISATVEMPLEDDSPAGITRAIGTATIGFADVLQRLNPDLMILLGDRYEIFSAAQAGMVAQIPMAHIHGGEVTEGAIDEGIRHSITKMAHIHFVAAEEYRRRVIQLGEKPESVFCVGAMALDHLNHLSQLSRAEIEESLDWQLGKQNFLITYHPETIGAQNLKLEIEELLSALDEFPNARLFFTGQNADTHNSVIGEMISKYVEKNADRARLFISLGHQRYINLMRQVDVVIGNSSSGIIEAPMLLKPTVNIGNRQSGRLKASSVLDCSCNKLDIGAAMRKALSQEFQVALKDMHYPYGSGSPSLKIITHLKELNPKSLLKKKFYDNCNH